MFALHGMRRFSSVVTSRKEYPTSFLSHLRTQKLNVFNIGVAFLTLSLSSQMVAYKQRYEVVQKEKEELRDKVEMLEKLVLDLGGVMPNEESSAMAYEAEAQARRNHEEEAKALVTLTMDDTSNSKRTKLI